MSHFTVLTAVEVSQDDSIAWGLPVCHVTEKDGQMAALCAKPGEELSQISIIADLKMFESLIEDKIAVLLERYSESTINPDYLEYIDKTDVCREEYENGNEECVRITNGQILPVWDHRFCKHYEMYEGKVYRRRFGPLHHRKRTKKAKRIKPLLNYPLKKIYPSFDAYMQEYYGYELDNETGRYAFWTNPNKKWDWYQIGGRWPYYFLVKQDCQYAVCGELSYMCNDASEAEAPEGYRWVAGARKCDIAWDVMRGFYREKETERFYRFEEWFREGQMAGPMHGVVLTEEGIKDWWDKLMYRKDETLEEYLTRLGLSESVKYPVSPFACLDIDRGWKAEGDMGWFGMSYNNKEEDIWKQEVQDFIAAQADDTFLVVVDCHGC